MTKEKCNSVYTIVHQNVNRFSGKILDVELLLDKYSVDILCLTETWLKPENMCFSVNNCKVASVFNRDSAMGGGCIILVKDSIKCKERKDIVSYSVDRVCEIASAEFDGFLIVCIYRPPSGNLTIFFTLLEDLLDKIFACNKSIVICGDFNIDLLAESGDKENFISLLKCYNLDYLFNEPTRITPQSETCIDNVFVNCKIKSKVLISGVPSDHKAQKIELFCKNLKTENKVISFRPLTEKKSVIFKDKIIENLSFLNHNIDEPNESYNKLFGVITKEFNKVYTKKIVKFNKKIMFSEWATKGIRKSRDILYDLYDRKSHDSSPFFHDYVKKYSKIFKKVCFLAKSKFITNKIINSKNKVKATWNIINSETGKASKKESSFALKVNNELIEDKLQIANTFDSYFVNIPIDTTRHLESSSTEAQSLLKLSLNNNIAHFDFRHISDLDIIKTYKCLNKKRTEDLWGLSVTVLEPIIEVIAPNLAGIFNRCIDVGSFPDLMKNSKVTPIFKSGDTSNPANYRPVSVLPALSKIFESIIYTQMNAYFRMNRILHNDQFGFTKGRSTIDAGAKLVKNVLEAWETSRDTVGIFCDLSKAFDCVDHLTLIGKLFQYGVRGTALELIKSYLSKRNQKVGINDVVSGGSIVKMGVPQGSILGPFLFLVYINDLPFMVREMSEIALFAE